MSSPLLLQQLKDGNEKTFKQIMKSYLPRLYSFVNIYIVDKEVTEEIMQDTFMALWNQRRDLDDETCLITYLMVVSRNKCLNYLQHLQVREDVNEQLLNHAEWELNTRISTLEACDPGELFTAEAQEIVNKTLAGLPEQTRVVFIMSRYENKSHKTIAETLGITTKGVEYHISKALKKLHTSLKDYYPVFLYLFYIN